MESNYATRLAEYTKAIRIYLSGSFFTIVIVSSRGSQEFLSGLAKSCGSGQPDHKKLTLIRGVLRNF